MTNDQRHNYNNNLRLLFKLTDSNISLRSSAQAELLVPRTRTVIRQCRAFSVAGPTAWNGLPVALRLTPAAHSALFLSSLKTTLFDRGWTGSAPEKISLKGRYIKLQ